MAGPGNAGRLSGKKSAKSLHLAPSVERTDMNCFTPCQSQLLAVLSRGLVYPLQSKPKGHSVLFTSTAYWFQRDLCPKAGQSATSITLTDLNVCCLSSTLEKGDPSLYYHEWEFGPLVTRDLFEDNMACHRPSFGTRFISYKVFLSH